MGRRRTVQPVTPELLEVCVIPRHLARLQPPYLTSARRQRLDDRRRWLRDHAPHISDRTGRLVPDWSRIRQELDTQEEVA